MRDEIKEKLDNHIKEILSKPYISNEDYALLRQKLSELPASSSGIDWALPLLMLMLSFGFGGEKNGL